ncbi:MAG: glycosyltransferase family 4 protein [Methermicoccaceae archaeon]
MRIAIVAPPWFSVPPERYGGIEMVVSVLTEGLVDRGHDVVLFSVGNARTKARVFSVFDSPMRGYLDAAPASFLNTATTHVVGSYIEIARQHFDIIHDHTWKEGLCCGAFISTPVVHTIHGRLDDENRRFYSQFIGYSGVHFTTISEFQQTQLPYLSYAGVVYNAVDTHKYPYIEDKADFFLYLGRFNPDKAPHLACEVAEHLGLKLYLAGKISERAEREYFATQIKPHLSEKIVFIGEVSEAMKMELLSKARALLLPLQWDEPFGLVMVEAMACGTPVITLRRGAAPEIVEHGITGYVATTMDEFMSEVERVDEISPEVCRRRVEERFSARTMVEGYERVYERVLDMDLR